VQVDVARPLLVCTFAREQPSLRLAQASTLSATRRSRLSTALQLAVFVHQHLGAITQYRRLPYRTNSGITHRIAGPAPSALCPRAQPRRSTCRDNLRATRPSPARRDSAPTTIAIAIGLNPFRSARLSRLLQLCTNVSSTILRPCLMPSGQAVEGSAQLPPPLPTVSDPLLARQFAAGDCPGASRLAEHDAILHRKIHHRPDHGRRGWPWALVAYDPEPQLPSPHIDGQPSSHLE